MGRTKWLLALIVALGFGLVAMPVAADRGDTALVGQSFRLAPGERLNGDLAIFAGSAEIAEGAVVTGDVAVIGGSMRIDGTVEGDAVVLGGNMTLGPQAWIKGDLVALGALTRDPGARVDGSVVVGAERTRQLQEARAELQRQRTLPEAWRLIPGGSNARLDWLWSLLRWIAGLAGLVILAVIVTAVLPEALPHISEAMGRTPLLSLAVGLVTVLAAALVMPLLAITIIGIPIALVLGIALALAALCGWVAAADLAGEKLLRLLHAAAPAPLLRVVTGVVVLGLLARVPCLGTLFTAAVICWGLGSVILTRFGTSRNLIWSPFQGFATGTAGLRPSVRAATAAAEAGAPERVDKGTRQLSPRDLDEEMGQYTER